MKRSRPLILVLGIAIFISLWLLFKPSPKMGAASATDSAPVDSSASDSQAKGQSSPNAPSALVSPVAVSGNKVETVALNQRTDVLKLNAMNFKELVLMCFKGLPCAFEVPPMDLYQRFRRDKDHKATDLLLSYMRSRLKNPEFAKSYKATLKEMIDDFYPENEKQFQEAAYYNYLGDLNKSLELYLDLEKKSEQNPSLRPAPPLNIANTYYDLGRFPEALPYYQAALRELESASDKNTSGSEVLLFIKLRISEIQKK